MRRNPFKQANEHMARVARNASMTPAEHAALPPSQLAGGLAGAIDPATGEWAGYGLLGVTAVGAFRLKAGVKG